MIWKLSVEGQASGRTRVGGLWHNGADHRPSPAKRHDRVLISRRLPQEIPGGNGRRTTAGSFRASRRTWIAAIPRCALYRSAQAPDGVGLHGISALGEPLVPRRGLEP